MTSPAQLSSLPVDPEVARILLAGALGLFLGLEREWAHKSAGVRTFALISIVGATFTVIDRPGLLLIGGFLVIVQGALLAVRGLREDGESLSLTTGVSMLVAFGVGVLVADGMILEGVTVAVVSAFVLISRRELHDFAWGLTREELRSAAEFAILAFIIFPLLPSDPLHITEGGLEITVELQVIWLMVITVAGIGIVNYAIVQAYGGRGIAVTGFFGGLASSTAVVGTMLDHVRQRPDAVSYAVAAILLADAAMAVRNLVIAVAFTLQRGVLLLALVPLLTIVLGSVAIAYYSADWRQHVEMDLDSPFSLRNALVFGGIFLLVVVAGGAAQAQFGSAGLYITAVLSGFVSSAGATTSAVLLYRGGGITAETASFAVLAATGASVAVKAALTYTSSNSAFARRVTLWSAVLLLAAAVATAGVVALV